MVEERIVQADPVEDPQGYQQELLALLDGQDAVKVLAATPATVQEYLGGVPQELLEKRPEPGEWSAVEVLGHLWDAEIAYAWRARLILAQGEPPLTAYDQDAWATLPRPSYAELLVAFTALRTANLVLVRQATAAQWERAGMHTERGRTSFRLLTETIAGHDRAHLEQLRRTIATVRG